MSIEEITIYPFDLQTSLHFSYGQVTCLPFLIIKIAADSVDGFGECVLTENVTTQTKEAVRAAQELLGSNPNFLEDIIPAWMEEKQYRSVREAFSIALYDLAGKKKMCSTASLLGGCKRNPVPGMPVILLSSLQDAIDKAQFYVKQGFETIKLKFSGILEEDLLLLKSIRNAIGNDIKIFADANKGYKNYNSALEAVNRFEKYRLGVFEDPFNGELNEYALFKKKTSIKIMLDAYARSLKDLRDVLVSQAADIINLHPNHQGGLGRALKMESLARAHNVPIMVGGCGLLGISTAAFQSLASVIGLEFPCGELGGHIDHGFELCLAKNPYSIANGMIQIPEASGLGIDIDTALLNKLTIRKMVVR